METTLKTAPAVEPLTKTEVARHIRVDESDPDTSQDISDWIKTAREDVEDITWRRLITQTWYGYLQDWPSGDYIELPFGSLQSVTAIKYTDTDAAVTTWDSDEYIVGTDYQKGRVTLDDGYTWPNETLYPSNPIEIEFVCGYGLAADVPWKIKQAMKIMIGELNENREKSVVGTIYTKIDTIENLLSNYRLNEL